MQKSVIILALAGFFACGDAQAQMAYMEEIRALGAISGQGLACGSTKYDTFELLARAILLTKSPSEVITGQAIRAYNEEKANAYFSKQMDGGYDCADINRRFDNQAIFQAVLYADGTIKMPDGQILTPRRPYDATLIYEQNNQDHEQAKAIYDGSGTAKILKVDVQNAPREAQPAVLHTAQPARITPSAQNDPADFGIKKISRKP